MKKFVAAIAALAAVTLAPAAEARDFDLGFARTGMLLGQLRFAAWPPGLTVFCSDDQDRPREVDRLLSLPRQMVDMGAVRCALLKVDEAGKYKAATRKIGGQPVEISATFGPDPAGAKRLVQLFLQAPREGYDGLVAHFTSRLGKPSETGERFVRWTDPTAEALVMHDEGDTAMGMLVDLRMQDAMNTKMQMRR